MNRLFKTFLKCVDTPGTYICECDEGFEIVGESCNNVNECNQHGTCEAGQKCIDTVGSYTCLCNDGFSEGINSCDDTDECAIGEHNCYPWTHRYIT